MSTISLLVIDEPRGLRLGEPDNESPLAQLMNLLSGPWTMLLLYQLHFGGPTRFGALRRRLLGVSTKVLTERLRMLEREGLIDRHYEPTVPPQVTYSLTQRMHEIGPILAQLATVAWKWYGSSTN